MSAERELARACLMFANEHGGRLPLAGKLYIKTANTIDPNRIPTALGDSTRSMYVFASAPDVATTPWYLVPWNSAIANYFAKSFSYKDSTTGKAYRSSVIPTDNWNYVEDAINSPSGPWKYFLCIEAQTQALGGTQDGAFNPTPATQATVVDVYDGPTASTPEYIWSSNTDYTFNEGLLGWDDIHTQYRRLKGKYGGFREPSSLILMTDGQRRTMPNGKEIAPDPTYLGFNDAWQVWTPNASATTQTSAAVPLSGALATTATVDSPYNFDYMRHKNKINIAFVDGHVETRIINANDLSNVYLLPRP
jgi:prepilin-type processing-associated H-X9-DG protein